MQAVDWYCVSEQYNGDTPFLSVIGDLISPKRFYVLPLSGYIITQDEAFVNKKFTKNKNKDQEINCNTTKECFLCREHSFKTDAAVCGIRE